MSPPDQQDILILAERLARRERFHASWLTHPRWAGSDPTIQPYLEKADKFKKWAEAILTKEIAPPAWLAEEDMDFRDPGLNPPPENPNRLSAAARRTIEHTRFACRIALETPLPSYEPLPKPKQRPGKEAIIDLAMRLGHGRIAEFLFHYPPWASYPYTYDERLRLVARLKQQAEAILNGEERPPPWLVDKEPRRWMHQPEVRTAPAPAKLSEADAHLQRKACPLIAAWMLLAAGAPAPPPERPPPLVVWRSPRRPVGDACPDFPPACERRCVSRDLLLWQLKSGLFAAEYATPIHPRRQHVLRKAERWLTITGRMGHNEENNRTHAFGPQGQPNRRGSCFPITARRTRSGRSDRRTGSFQFWKARR